MAFLNAGDRAFYTFQIKCLECEKVTVVGSKTSVFDKLFICSFCGSSKYEVVSLNPGIVQK